MSKSMHRYTYKRGRTPICERCGCRRRSNYRHKWVYSMDGRVWTVDRPPCQLPAASTTPRATGFGRRPDLDRASRALVTAFYLYNGYTVGSRGPSGCILTALDEIAPDVAKEIREGDVEVSDIYQRRWGEEP